MTLLADLADGFLVVVRSDCETCQMVQPVLATMVARTNAIASQDDEAIDEVVAALTQGLRSAVEV